MTRQSPTANGVPPLVSPTNTSTPVTSPNKATANSRAATATAAAAAMSPKSSGAVIDTIRIEGKFYDTKALAAIHPGGQFAVVLNNHTDATTMFLSSHRRAFPHDKYKHLQVPEALVDTRHYRETTAHGVDYSFYLEICEKIRPLVSKTNGFAPWSYFVKVSLLMLVAFYLDFLILRDGPVWFLSALHGLCFSFIGLNVQHDANHGSVSKKGWVNRVWGMSQDYIGGSAMAWSINHNTIHHVFCNDPDRDRDLNIPLLRLHDKIQWRVPYVFQAVYFSLLEAGFGLTHIVVTWYMLWIQGPTPSQQLLKPYWGLHRALVSFVPLRVALLVYWHGVAATAIHLVIAYGIGGFYLAFFFLISHNYEGVDKAIDATKGCFVRNQVESSSNVGGAWLAFLNGGLNYQIEHHLFPRVHHSYYSVIAPTVRAMCEKRGINYFHFDNVLMNSVSVFQHLIRMGTDPTKPSAKAPSKAGLAGLTSPKTSVAARKIRESRQG